MIRIHRTVLTALAVALLAAPAGVFAKAGPNAPSGGSFHLDVRTLTLIQLDYVFLDRADGSDDTEQTIGLGTDWGGTGAGIKLGYLIKGHHDVGAHFLITYQGGTTRNTTKDAENTALRQWTLDGRLAPYYNYNWEIDGWIMPYLGAMAGLDLAVSRFENVDDNDTRVTTTSGTLFGGMETGVRLFPFEHVALDVGLLVLAGPSRRSTRADDPDAEDFNWSGFTIDGGLQFGLNVFF